MYLGSDSSLSVCVSGINVRIVGIHYVYFFIVDEVSFMTVALMRIQVYDHHSADAMVLPRHMNNETDVRVYAEATPMRPTCVMVPTG